MAFTAKHNITTALSQDLISAGDNAGAIKSINLANVHIISSVSVDLIIYKSSSQHYIIKNVVIPSGTSLVIDMSEIPINTSLNQDSLRIKLTKGATFTLTGSIDPAASTTVTGVSTLFLTEISIGDEIVVSSETRTVTAIASDTSLEVSVAFSDNSNDTAPDCNPTAIVDVIINT